MENRDTVDWLQPENRLHATPMDLLRQGLLKKNWDAVQACYTALTGQVLNTSSEDVNTKTKRKRGRPRKIPLPEPSVPVEDTKPVPVTELPTDIDPLLADCVAPAKANNVEEKNYAKSRSHDCRPHRNLFNDDGTEAPDEIVKNRNVPDAILNAKRVAVKDKRVRCQNCNKVEEVNPALLPYSLRLTKDYVMRYFCNDCIVGNRSNMQTAEIDNGTFIS